MSEGLLCLTFVLTGQLREYGLDYLCKVEANVGHGILAEADCQRYQFIVEKPAFYLFHDPLDKEKGLDALSKFLMSVELTSLLFQGVL